LGGSGPLALDAREKRELRAMRIALSNLAEAFCRLAEIHAL
jgi:hypothetical protein